MYTCHPGGERLGTAGGFGLPWVGIHTWGSSHDGWRMTRPNPHRWRRNGAVGPKWLGRGGSPGEHLPASPGGDAAGDLGGGRSESRPLPRRGVPARRGRPCTWADASPPGIGCGQRVYGPAALRDCGAVPRIHAQQTNPQSCVLRTVKSISPVWIQRLTSDPRTTHHRKRAICGHNLTRTPTSQPQR